MKEFYAEPYCGDRYRLGESARYDDRTKTLSWVDIEDGRGYFYKDGKISYIQIHERIGTMLPSENIGEYIIFGTTGIYSTDGKSYTLLRGLTDIYLPHERSNDCSCDARGRCFVGSSSYGEDAIPSGNLYCMDHGSLLLQQKDAKISNGMAWSKDHRKFFFSDTWAHGVYSYDYDIETGNISNRTLLFPITNGFPDGMTMDADENLYVAIWEGSRVECRDSKTGELLSVIHVPARHVTSCCFLGDGSNELFITSSYENLTGENEGRNYKCEIDGVGTPSNTFSYKVNLIQKV